jgi:group I intron endonuclease
MDFTSLRFYLFLSGEIMQGIIYLITNKITGEMYVGQTIQKLHTRWKRHCNLKSQCSKISNAIKKYTPEQFYIDQIDYGTSFIELNMKEVYWIQKLNTLSPNGYNLQIGGKNGSPSKETKQKIGNGRRGKKHTEESKSKISKTRKSRTYKITEERKQKMREICYARKGTKRSPESVERMKIAQIKYRKENPIVSAETRKKISIGQQKIAKQKGEIARLYWTGRKHTEETKAKMRISNAGRKHTEESKKKLSEAKKGKKLSEETLNKRKNTIAKNKLLKYGNPNFKVHKKSILDTKIENIKLLLSQNVPLPDIAKIVNVSRSYIYTFIKSRKLLEEKQLSLFN